jgi:hypothetical protein
LTRANTTATTNRTVVSGFVNVSTARGRAARVRGWHQAESASHLAHSVFIDCSDAVHRLFIDRSSCVQLSPGCRPPRGPLARHLGRPAASTSGTQARHLGRPAASTSGTQARRHVVPTRRDSEDARSALLSRRAALTTLPGQEDLLKAQGMARKNLAYIRESARVEFVAYS